MKTNSTTPNSEGRKPKAREAGRSSNPERRSEFFVSDFGFSTCFRIWFSGFGVLSLATLLLALTGCAPSSTQSITPPIVPSGSLDPSLFSLLEASRQAVLAAPKSADAWGKLGQAFHAAEFFGEAQSCYARAAQLDEDSPRWPHLLGLLQLQDQFETALTNLARAAQLAGSDPDAPRLRLAQALVERARIDAAAQQLQILLAANSNQAAARLEMARIHLAREELPHAVELLQPCFTNTYTARPALLLLAQIHQRQGRTVEAASLSSRVASMPRPFDWPDPFLREVQSLRVDRHRVADVINGLLVQQRFSEADTALKKFLIAAPNEPEAWLLLGRLRFQQRQCSEAEAALRRHLEMQPDSANGLIQLALAQLCQQQWTNAAATLRHTLAVKPDFTQAHYNLGYALARSGDTSGAIQSYRNALRCTPGDVEAHVALAEGLVRSGQSAEAMQHVERALDLDPNDARARQLRQRLSR